MSYNKILLVLFLGLFLFSLVSAERTEPFLFDTGTPGDCIELVQTCDDCTYINISRILFPNSSVAVENVEMDGDGTYFNYSFCSTETRGVYAVNGYGDEGSSTTDWNYIFEITGSGVQLTQANAIIYIAFFVLLIFFFVTTFFGIGLLPPGNIRDGEGRILQISYLKYFRGTLWFFEWIFLLGIMYLAANLGFAYLGEELFANVFFTIFRIMLGVTPIIVFIWVFWIIVKVVQDGKLRRLMERGMGGTRL